MTGVIQLVKWQYEQILNETVTDPVVDSWPLMGSPLPILLIAAAYFYFVLILGPKMMEHRKPYDLSKVMIVYNLYQVIYCTWLCLWPLRVENGLGYFLNHYCHPIQGVENPVRSELRAAAWFFHFSKIVDLLDTVFFVLRKKKKQVTFLHIYHHSVLAVGTWFYLKYNLGEQGMLVGVINSFVHSVMYLYYCLAALGPKFQKYLWWKKHLTTLQMVQFMIFIFYLVTLLVLDCKLPKAMTVFMTINTAIFLALFYNFYYNTYKTDKERLHAAAKASQSESAGDKKTE